MKEEFERTLGCIMIYINDIGYNLNKGSTLLGRNIKALTNLPANYQLWQRKNIGDDSLIFDDYEFLPLDGDSFSMISIGY